MIFLRIILLILLAGLVSCSGDINISNNSDILIQDYEESNKVIFDIDYKNSETFDLITKNNSLSEPY